MDKVHLTFSTQKSAALHHQLQRATAIVVPEGLMVCALSILELGRSVVRQSALTLNTENAHVEH
jgi:hypothetical protein